MIATSTLKLTHHHMSTMGGSFGPGKALMTALDGCSSGELTQQTDKHPVCADLHRPEGQRVPRPGIDQRGCSCAPAMAAPEQRLQSSCRMLGGVREQAAQARDESDVHVTRPGRCVVVPEAWSLSLCPLP